MHETLFYLHLPLLNLRIVLQKVYVDGLLKGTSIIRNTAHVEFNNKILDIVRFVKFISNPAVREPLTAKNYVDKGISNSAEESSLLRLDLNEEISPD